MSLSNSTNLLLARLDSRVLDLLKPHLRPVSLPLGKVLFEEGQNVDYVYFPTSGLLSLVVMLEDGGIVEAAMIGRNGAAGGGSAFGISIALNKTLVQIAGNALYIPTARLKETAKQEPALVGVLGRNEQALFVQAQQSAACNVTHTAEQRMSRWLLESRDFIGSNCLFLTQEFLATMIGVRRTTVTTTALHLKTAGLINYRRGTIQILDGEGLEELACECYGRIKRHYTMLLGPEAMDYRSLAC